MKNTQINLSNLLRNIAASLALGLSLFTPKLALAEAIVTPPNSIFNNGIHFYGKSPLRDQLGVEYLIFSVENNRLVGAFYQVSSEFNCFYGNVNQGQINLSIIDPYDNAIYPYNIALENVSPVATGGENLPVDLRLSGYHPLADYNEHDLEMLNICRQDLEN
jgi:hypothetical protein